MGDFETDFLLKRKFNEAELFNISVILDEIFVWVELSNDVVAIGEDDDVCAVSSDELIVTVTAIEGVIARATIKNIIAVLS